MLPVCHAYPPVFRFIHICARSAQETYYIMPKKKRHARHDESIIIIPLLSRHHDMLR